MIFDPASAFLGWALLAAALCWLALQCRGAAGAMILSLGLLLATNLLIGSTRLAQVYATRPIAARLALHRADGLGFTGARYHAEFNFAARLTRPVAELTDLAAIRAWTARHPRGVMTGRTDRSAPPWRPSQPMRAVLDWCRASARCGGTGRRSGWPRALPMPSGGRFCATGCAIPAAG